VSTRRCASTSSSSPTKELNRNLSNRPQIRRYPTPTAGEFLQFRRPWFLSGLLVTSIVFPAPRCTPDAICLAPVCLQTPKPSPTRAPSR
jgi:hypothetical protein